MQETLPSLTCIRILIQETVLHADALADHLRRTGRPVWYRDPSVLHTLDSGSSEFDRIASNDTPKGRSENRRIELVLLPDLSELPTLPEDLAQAAKTAPEK